MSYKVKRFILRHTYFNPACPPCPPFPSFPYPCRNACNPCCRTPYRNSTALNGWVVPPRPMPTSCSARAPKKVCLRDLGCWERTCKKGGGGDQAAAGRTAPALTSCFPAPSTSFCPLRNCPPLLPSLA